MACKFSSTFTHAFFWPILSLWISKWKWWKWMQMDWTISKPWTKGDRKLNGLWTHSERERGGAESASERTMNTRWAHGKWKSKTFKGLNNKSFISFDGIQIYALNAKKESAKRTSDKKIQFIIHILLTCLFEELFLFDHHTIPCNSIFYLLNIY